MNTKVLPNSIKAVSDTGDIEFYASVFGNRDKAGDRVLPGAFDVTIAEWQSKATLFPIVWSHQIERPQNVIGSADPADLTTDAKGLLVRGKLDVEGNPQAKYVHTLVRRRIATGASFMYNVVRQRKATDANELQQLDLIEAGPCLVGANPEAGIVAVKDLHLMSGTELNALFETLNVSLKAATSGADLRDRLRRFY